MEIKEKRIIVTGGANGIGRELSIKLQQEGAIVGAFDLSGDALNQLRAYNGDIHCTQCDITDYSQVEESIDAFCKFYGGVDILVNNAGIIHNALLLSLGKGHIAKYDVNIWNKVIATNLSAVFYVTENAAKKMIEQRIRGLIINVSSICAAGNLGQSAYSAAKAGVNALTVTWAKEMGLFGIRVAGIAPGFVQTNTTLQSMQENVLNEWKKKTPLRRLASVGEIVDGILFIIKNDFYNGRILELDGGLRL
jgi:3-oxoacyl-[acyl-carrier protein] reductase